MSVAQGAPADPGAAPALREFTEAINREDLDSAAGCFARDACLLTPDSTAIRGREEIRSIIAQLIARQIRIELLASSILTAGDVAMATQSWRIRSPGPAGTTFLQSSDPQLVLKVIEGKWKLAIATLWGS